MLPALLAAKVAGHSLFAQNARRQSTGDMVIGGPSYWGQIEPDKRVHQARG